MASIIDEGNGRRRVELFNGQGERKRVRLGVIDAKSADTVRALLERLAGHRRFRTALAPDLAAWLDGLPDALHQRIERAGLADPRSGRCALGVNPTLGVFLADYFATLAVKDATQTAYGHTRRNLLDYFGEDTRLADVTAKGVEQFRGWLRTKEGLSAATASRRIRAARMLFHAARRWKLLGENPFDGVRAGGETNDARRVYVDRKTIERVISHAGDPQWKLLIALSRYGGMRCPSEHLGLRWEDVRWDEGKLLVRSPKTEHHADGAQRYVPIFPELQPYLQAAFDAAPERQPYVIHQYRDSSANLRTRLLRIIRRAGVKTWPRLWHNLRASCETDLLKRWPVHVVADWLGHDPQTALRHYAMTTQADYLAASGGPVEATLAGKAEGDVVQVSASLQTVAETGGAQSGALSGALVGESGGIERNPAEEDTRNCQENREMPTKPQESSGPYWT